MDTETGRFEQLRRQLPDAALIWFPRHGEVIGRFGGSGVWLWLRRACHIRSPKHDPKGDYWHLPRTSLGPVLRASLDAYGAAILVRDGKKLAVCNANCQKAEGPECMCSCLGQEHGVLSGRDWVELGASYETLVAEDHIRLVRVLMAPSLAGGDAPRLYASELAGHLYTSDPASRKAQQWPQASRFVCASCVTAQARVWDHCHEHGYVRGPLCNQCNTRHWRGWALEHGRTTPLENIDSSYYRNCPNYEEDHHGPPCSA